MKHVFVSYAKEDAEAARALAGALTKANISVWWDRKIPLGKTWHDSIGRALDAAVCVIVLWSRTSVESRWVREEAERAATRGCVIPVLLEEVAPPLGFGLIQAANLSGWRGNDEDPRFAELLAAVLELTTASESGLAKPVSGSLNTELIHRNIRRPPPAATRESRGVDLDPCVVDRPINLGFDGPVDGGLPHGWFNSHLHVSGVSTDYTIRVIEREDSVSGMCMKLFKSGARPEEFGSVMQRFPASYLAGQTVRLEGELRTDRVGQWAGFWLRADGEERPDLFFDNMQDRRLTGTTPWTRHAVDAKLPRETVWLNLGVVLCGNGVVYADNLRLLRWTSQGVWIDV